MAIETSLPSNPIFPILISELSEHSFVFDQASMNLLSFTSQYQPDWTIFWSDFDGRTF